MSKVKTKGLLNIRSNLWNYLYDNHGLTLLESEINDILELARQEIELPEHDEIEREYPTRGLIKTENGSFIGSAVFEMWTNSEIQKGIDWALKKVRNPYPKQINP